MNSSKIVTKSHSLVCDFVTLKIKKNLPDDFVTFKNYLFLILNLPSSKFAKNLYTYLKYLIIMSNKISDDLVINK